MNRAVQIPGRLFALVDQFPFATSQVRVLGFVARGGAERNPAIDCQINEQGWALQ